MIKKIIPLILLLPFLFLESSFKAPIDYAIGEDSVFDGYPTPTDKNMLFYIQKTFNTNAVVYTLNIDEKSQLIEDEPVNVFWRRYQEEGQKRELKYFERTFGFGVKSKMLDSKPNTVEFTIVALKDRKIFATVNKKKKAVAVTTINGKPAFLEKVFITAQHVKLLPEVFAVELFGKEVKTGKYTYEKIVKKEEEKD